MYKNISLTPCSKINPLQKMLQYQLQVCAFCAATCIRIVLDLTMEMTIYDEAIMGQF